MHAFTGVIGRIVVAMSLLEGSFVSATQPTTPYRSLETRAAKEGAAAVRQSYQREIEAITESLNAQQNVTSIRQSSQQMLTILWQFDWLASWALIEARELRMKKGTSRGLENSVFKPMLRGMDCALAAYREEMPRMTRLMTKAPPQELAELGLTNFKEEGATNDRDIALRRVALLLKLAGARRQLEQLFLSARTPIGSAPTPEKFLAYPHDVDAMLGIANNRR